MITITIFTLFLVFNLRFNVLGEFENVCRNHEKECNGNTEYSFLWSQEENKILKLIEESENAYQPCQFKNASCFFSTIQNDLNPFSQGISKEMISFTRSRFHGTRYQLINHTLYRDKTCMFPTRCSGNEYFLKKFTNGSDYELIINVHDWAQSFLETNPAPIFSFSKTNAYADIMYPAWSFWAGGPATKLYSTGLGRWDLLYKSLIKESKKWPWSEKKNIAFFRGSRTNEERDGLIYLSRESPNLVDASYTKNQAFKSIEKDTLNATPAEEVTMEHHCQYKYVFNFRGVAASFRFRHLFLCQSLVFHVGDGWLEFFYLQLKPWIHYVPVNKNYTKEELRRLLEFFKKHDDIAEKIASRGYRFIKTHLKISDVSLYWKVLLEEYTKLLNFKPKLDAQLIRISD